MVSHCTTQGLALPVLIDGEESCILHPQHVSWAGLTWQKKNLRMTHRAGRGHRTSPRQLYQDDGDKTMSSAWLTPGTLCAHAKALVGSRSPRVTAARNGFGAMIKTGSEEAGRPHRRCTQQRVIRDCSSRAHRAHGNDVRVSHELAAQRIPMTTLKL